MKEFCGLVLLTISFQLLLPCVASDSNNPYEKLDINTLLSPENLDDQIKQNPTNYSLYRSRASLLIDKQQYAKAEPDCQTWLRLRPNDADAHAFLAMCYGGEGKFEESFKEYDRALEIDPNNIRVFIYRSMTYRQQGRLDLAKKDEEALLAAGKRAERKLAAAGAEKERSLPKASSANIGTAIALFNSGRFEKALPQAKLLADRGDRQGQYLLGAIYDYGIEFVNHEKSAIWYEKSAAQNFAPAQERLAWKYRLGIGVKKDLNKARSLFEKAARQGDKWAAEQMGVICYDTKNFPAALRWFDISIAAGPKEFSVARDVPLLKQHCTAHYRLGQMYEKGLGVRQDKKLAAYHYRIAAQNGDSFAADSLKKLR